MSLDVYLAIENYTPLVETEPSSGIFIRRDGANVEVTREEWDRLHPGQEPVVIRCATPSNEVYTANITHNLGKMAREAGFYEACWRPDEMGIETAQELIEPLTKGLETLKGDRARFEQFNPSNGWGDYDGLVNFAERYLEACKKWPEAKVSVWR